MVKVTLKDGVVKEFEPGISAADIAKSIGMGLYKAACAVRINGEAKDLRTTVNEDCTMDILTFADDEGKHAFWHTAAHIMAQAIQHLYPEAHFGIGPALENGWYYDVGGTAPFTPDQFPAIEAEMKKIVKADLPIEQRIISLEEGRKLFANQPYKLELLEEYAEKGWELSVYTQGDYTDLCAGPHLMSTGAVKAVKLTNATSAYWRGDAKNDSLCRVYGVAFPKASELEEYVKQQEEALKRDHNKIGRELEYFTTVESIGQGLPVLLPKGARVIQLLQRFVEDEEQKRGYLLTKTPLMAKRDLYRISGHWDHYLDGMFVLGDPHDETKECFALRPMTCPFQYQVYLNRKRSYRDLPMRLGETSTLFRNEDSGEMHGLIRVRQFTISEGHLILRPDQLEEEFRGCLELANYMLETVGLKEDVSYRFSQWDPARSDKYEGTRSSGMPLKARCRKFSITWDWSIKWVLTRLLSTARSTTFKLKTCSARKNTLITIQIDMLLAQKFGMVYIGEDGQEHTPYIIHRTSLGCYERSWHCFWKNMRVLCLCGLHRSRYALFDQRSTSRAMPRKCSRSLKHRVRATADCRDEKRGYKIRQAQMKKCPICW